MANVYDNVRLTIMDENGVIKNSHDTPLKIQLCKEKDKAHISLMNGGAELESVPLDKDYEVINVGKSSVVIGGEEDAYLLKFSSSSETKRFKKDLEILIEKLKKSVFNLRTDPASAEQYFQFYGYLSQQQNMMQDYIRTSTYQRAMLDNGADFKDKVVLDVGAGSGILSFFAHQAGAKKVYAVEASSMALHCACLVDHNKLQDSIIVMPGKIEEVELPEKVDIIISEPMGYMLFNERMLETFLHAKKWLKPNGRMFPTQGDLHIAPFTDEALYMEQFSKANFWYQQAFHGVDLSSLRQAAVNEYCKQPVVDTFDVRICMARSHKYTVDFQTADESDLHNIEIPVSFTITQAGTVHGLAFWFDVAFIGSQTIVWLSTAPTQPLTHWYQVRCLLQNPIFVKQGQTLTGKVNLKCNTRQSYDVEIELTVPGMSNKSSNILDLKNPFFRYTGQAPQPPPGNNHTSPTDAYWNQADGSCTVGQVAAAVHGNYNVGSLLNGAVAGLVDVSQQPQYSNLVPLANVANVAPINPGSIPAATVVSLSQALQTRTSIGGGLSPSAFQQGVTITSATSSSYPISNQFMIGDYAIPGNMVLPTQGLNLNKSG